MKLPIPEKLGGTTNEGSYYVRPLDYDTIWPTRSLWSGGLVVQFPYDYIVKRNLVVWEPGGLVVWWSGGLVVWWSGGLVVWWSGLHRSAAKRRVAEKLCITKLHRSDAKRRVLSQKFYIPKILYHLQNNFSCLRLGIIQ